MPTILRKKVSRTALLMSATLFGAVVTSVSQAAAQEPIRLVFSTYLPPSYEYIWHPVESFIERIQERSDGRLQVDVFHSAQLFEGHDELAALSRGDIDITNMTGTYPSASVSVLGVFTLPFAFEDINHMRRALDEGLLDLGIREELRDNHDVVVLGVAPLDPYEFYSRETPILSEEDFSGKVWATTGATDAQAIELLGGSPTGMASSELYLAFDRGVVDATPRPLITGIGRSLDEVVNHITRGTFLVDTSILAINRQTWESIPQDLQEIIKEAAAERDADQFVRVQNFIDEALSYYEEHGVDIHQLDEDVLARLRETTRPVIEEWVQAVENGERYLEVIEATASE